MALQLPLPMLARSGEIPPGPGWSFELKWDGFRALVARNGDFRVRSRRGWEMTALLPELAALPAAGTFDGEIIAWDDFTANLPLAAIEDDEAPSPTRPTASRSSASTAGRSGLSSRAGTSGRAQSGYAA